MLDNYEHYRSKPVTIRACGPIEHRVLCHTHNGDAWAEVGHYIIEEPDGVGEYPCDPETFKRRWEIVQQAEALVRAARG